MPYKGQYKSEPLILFIVINIEIGQIGTDKEEKQLSLLCIGRKEVKQSWLLIS